jgi:hypothetical protein
MWETICEKGFRGVIRADEVFGWLPVQNDLDVRLSLAFNYLDDFANLKPAQEYSLEPQQVPEFYQKRNSEPLEDWRDRVYQQYRISYIQTGLHELVYPFVELLNPLLLDNIVNFTHQLPAKWRTSKLLYAEVVEELLPGIPFAQKPAIPEVDQIVKDRAVVQMIREEVTSCKAQHYISPTLVNELLPNLKTNVQAAHRVEANWKVHIKKAIPFKVKKLLRHSMLKYKMDNNQLAFRNYLIIKVAEKMQEDMLSIKKNA